MAQRDVTPIIRLLLRKEKKKNALASYYVDYKSTQSYKMVSVRRQTRNQIKCLCFVLLICYLCNLYLTVLHRISNELEWTSSPSSRRVCIQSRFCFVQHEQKFKTFFRFVACTLHLVFYDVIICQELKVYFTF